MEYYIVTKKVEIMLFAGKHMELKIIMLSEINNICFLSHAESRPKEKMTPI
jgi:hypothetical protein